MFTCIYISSVLKEKKEAILTSCYLVGEWMEQEETQQGEGGGGGGL